MVTLLRCAFLALSPIMCILSNNWLVVWMCLEVRTITFSFIVIIKRRTKEEPEAAMKYFIIQSRASGLLLALFLLKFFIIISRKEKTILRMVLILKIGAIPLHLWLLRVRKSLKWNLLTVLITWQKLAPIYLLLFSRKLIIIIRAIISIIVGTILQYKNNKIRLLIAYSSISNSCWIMIGIVIRTTITIIFISVYFLSVSIINLVFKNKASIKNSRIKKITRIHVIFFFILLLRGIPPTIAFVPKWMLIKEFSTQSMSFFSILFITFTAINFYIYLRLSLKLIINTERKNYHKIKINKIQTLFATIAVFCGILTMNVFCYVWIKDCFW